jgi:dihydrodipicolinate synthase/N-acetylneuraminate lyase
MTTQIPGAAQVARQLTPPMRRALRAAAAGDLRRDELTHPARPYIHGYVYGYRLSGTIDALRRRGLIRTGAVREPGTSYSAYEITTAGAAVLAALDTPDRGGTTIGEAAAFLLLVAALVGVVLLTGNWS